MRLLQAILLLFVAALTAIASHRLATGIGDREAVRQLAHWSAAAIAAATQPIDKYRYQPPVPDVDPAAFRRDAMDRATWNGWAVWGAALPLGLGVGFVMGRGGLHIGEPTVEHGEVGCAFFLIKLLLIGLVLGVGRGLSRIAGGHVGISYAAAAAGVITGVLLTIPLTLLLTVFTPVDRLDDVEGPIAFRVALLCGSLTTAAAAAALAPMITPGTRGGEPDVTAVEGL